MPGARDDFAIRHVASLARLRLTADEEALYARQLGDILAYATQLLQFDDDSTALTRSDGAPAAALRPDVVRPSVARDIALDGAPDRADGEGLFRVPRVIG